jgi:glyoxylase-like metal-dependent hydrolase (beta-lactamase superfamily II)/rhodanese-related sulfurtransferase
MKIEQIYTGCLAQGAYFIESDGEAAIIDPLREVEAYLNKAAQHGATVKYIFETHFHADFVSGHLDLARKTGARIVYGPGAITGYQAYVARDQEVFELGKIKIKTLHTPGHTLESTTFLLIDEQGKEHAIFTGDTLFIGDVGRPDLAINQNLTKEDLAGMLYDSLRNKIMTLPDEVIVYPAHGAGSACGKNMAKETWDTLGNQKKTNYALRNISKEQFIGEVCDGIAPPPQYFAKNAMINKTGYESLDHILKRGRVPLDVANFEAIANQEGALVLDTRSAAAFIDGHIPNSIFIGVDGNFAPWVGALITDLTQPIIFIAPEGREEEVVIRLSRVGYDNTLGFLQGGMEAWKAAGREVATVESLTAAEVEARLTSSPAPLIDVRRPGEFESGHIEEAINAPLDFINEYLADVPREKPALVHCAGGYRSVIFISILQARGYDNLINVEGGYGALSATGLKKAAGLVG